jgi:phosphotransferase system  glucose/maltose/N-acetylglucosamine-specific IIC component
MRDPFEPAANTDVAVVDEVTANKPTFGVAAYAGADAIFYFLLKCFVVFSYQLTAINTMSRFFTLPEVPVVVANVPLVGKVTFVDAVMLNVAGYAPESVRFPPSDKAELPIVIPVVVMPLVFIVTYFVPPIQKLCGDPDGPM